MIDVLLAALLFAAAVTTHIFFCRRTTQSGLHAKAFILMAIGYLIIYALVACQLQHSGIFQPQSLWGVPLKITAGIIFVLLIPAYLSFYVLTQLMSPSKKILTSLSRHKNLSYAEILASVEEEKFIDTRLSDLLTSGCVERVDGYYRLSLSGQKIATVLNIMQSMLGREKGG